MSIEERLDMKRDDRRHEDALARLSGRRKFTGCRECGGDFGMQGICREALAMMYYSQQYVRWHKEAGNSEYLFVVCRACNPEEIIPDGFTAMSADEVLAWLNPDPMSLDYAALAREPEAATAGEDSHESAEI